MKEKIEYEEAELHILFIDRSDIITESSDEWKDETPTGNTDSGAWTPVI